MPYNLLNRMLSSEVPDTLEQLCELAHAAPELQASLLHTLLNPPTSFEHLVRDNADFRLLVKSFNQLTEPLAEYVLQPNNFCRLIRNSYDFNFTLGLFPHLAHHFFAQLKALNLTPRLFGQYPQLRTTASRWPEFRLTLLDLTLQNPKHALSLFVYPIHLSEALQRFPERRAALVTLVLRDLARAQQLVVEEENLQRLIPLCRGLHPAFNTNTVAEFHEYLLQQQRNRQEVRKNARLLASLSRHTYSYFSQLPEELLLKIAADTADLSLMEAVEARTLAEQDFRAPPATYRTNIFN